MTSVGSLENLKKWWDLLQQEGWKFGYHVKASKSHIIVKEKYQDKAKEIFQGSKITIPTEGHRHLGSVIGSKKFKESYTKEHVSKWFEQLTIIRNCKNSRKLLMLHLHLDTKTHFLLYVNN